MSTKAGQAQGSCADFELPAGAWPDSGSGTAQTWTAAAQTSLLTECYWFAGYVYAEEEGAPDSTSVELIPHPLHGGTFVDDSFLAETDTIAGYGRLGFGMAGTLPLPQPNADGLDNPPGDDGPVLPDVADESEELDPNMGLWFIRWPAPSFVDVDLGHIDEDANISSADVEHLIEDASSSWTNQFAAAVFFNVIDRGEHWFPCENDGLSTVNWAEFEVPSGNFAGSWAQPDFAGCAERIRDIDIRFREHYNNHNMCWVDCSVSHDPCVPDGNGWNTDIATIARHEWGHGALGLDDYEPPDWDASIMSVPWEEPPQCTQRDLGPTDHEFAQWAYDGIQSDYDEPANDYWQTGRNLGALNFGTSLDNGFLDGLPGYIDVDVFQFQVGSTQAWWRLYFTVNHGGDPGASYALEVRLNQCLAFFTSAFPGQDLHYECQAAPGLWQAKVRTADGIVSAPSQYWFQVALGGQASGVSPPAPDGAAELEFRVNPVTRLVSGSGLGRPGTLDLFDAAGRRSWSRNIAGSEFWSEIVDASLPSGVYFLRLSDGQRAATRRLVVVR